MMRSALGLLALTALSTSRAALAAPCDTPRPTTIVFGNGMFTTNMEAMEAAHQLRVALEQAQPSISDEGWLFEIAYNQTEPVVEQLLEVAEQRVAADVASFWRMLSGIEIAPDWFREAVASIATNVQQAPSVDDPDLVRHVARYRELLLARGRVALVAHSQGNLYANAAYSALLETEGATSPLALAIVAVASPADQVAGMGPYTTLQEDFVIAAVRAAFPATLAPNLSAAGADIETLGHGFSTAYLRAEASRAQIVQNVLATIARLPEPAATATSPSTGAERTCSDAEAEPEPVACESSGWTGTCAATFFEPCWDGEGACVIDIIPSGSVTFTYIDFENGAGISSYSIFDWDNLYESTTHLTYTSSTDIECGKGEMSLSDDPTCTVNVTQTSAAGQLSYCIDLEGVVRGICPDGSNFSFITSSTCGAGESMCTPDEF